MNALPAPLRHLLENAAQDARDVAEAGALAALAEFPGLPDEKVSRLRGVARAAADGLLDRDRLRALPVSDALTELQGLRGVGPFAAQGILHRGAGLVDEVTDDEVTREAVMLAYRRADITRLKTRNDRGEMVPLGALVTVRVTGVDVEGLTAELA